tara:strand:+ start:681 stop:944 length:264 start_codon:yes stop_codon:yes gene_type:complete
MKTYKEALYSANVWANSKPYTISKAAAKQYIMSMPQAEREGEQFYNSIARGRGIQLVYILSNLQGWRGEEARIAKAIIKEQAAKDNA